MIRASLRTRECSVLRGHLIPYKKKKENVYLRCPYKTARAPTILCRRLVLSSYIIKLVDCLNRVRYPRCFASVN